MTLPASGAISISMVATELGIAKPLSLGDSRVRALAGVTSGPISLGQLRGKSAYTPMTANGYDADAVAESTFVGGSVSCSPYVTVANGSGGYTYAWSFTSNPFGCGLTLATEYACRVSHSYARNANGSATATLQCVISDNTGHSITVTGVGASLSWSS